MAEFILKDWYGKEKSFDRDTVYFQDAEGNLLPFTHGTGNPTLEDLEVTENGNYTPPDGVDGFGSVSVNVPEPEIKLQDKTVTENGTYSADSGYDGLGSVTVEVEGSGGGSLPAGVYWEQQAIKPPTEYYQCWFKLNGNLYCTSLNYKGAGNNPTFYKWNGSAWTQVIAATIMVATTGYEAIEEFNGKLHFGGGDYTKHMCWDGVSGSITNLNAMPGKVYNRNSMFVYKGKLMCFTCNDSATAGLYEWDETSDTWTRVMVAQAYYYYFWLPVGDDLYSAYNKKIYKYENGALTQIGTLASSMKTLFTDGERFLYTTTTSAGYLQPIYHYDFETNTSKIIGYAPNYASGVNRFWYADGKIQLTQTSGDGTYATNLIMHEVTE